MFVLDLSKDELVNDLKTVNDLSDSQLFANIVLKKSYTHDGEPFGLICGNYEFDLNVEDTATLIRMAKIGNTLKAPFISQIKPRMLGIKQLSDSPSSSDWNLSDDSNEGKLWTMLRTFSESSSLGLALPRFLLRLPYGENTEPTETFSFEEFNIESDNSEYLWANPSFAFGLLFAQTFRTYGWEVGNKFYTQIDGLPVHHFQVDEQTNTKSCAEIDMTHEACDILIEQGLMPLISFRNTDSIKFADFQSVAFPSKALQGRWS